MSYIGIDESGKGDYFGYLVIAGVIGDSQLFRGLNIKDSKLLSTKQIFYLREEIITRAKYNIVSISPRKYNQLYKKIQSLNKILAWGHSRVIENLLEKNKVNKAISDKFGDKSFVVDALMERGRKIKLVQEHRAERYKGVAAASILARSEYLLKLAELSKKVDFKLPRGSTHVIGAGKELIKKHGKEILDKVAKKHFKTTKKILE